jgi:apolipoprotein N-acyltransferase
MIRLAERMDNWSRGRRGLTAFAMGALAALSLPPIGAWPMLFVAVPVFLVLLARAPLQTWRSGFGHGWLFGFGYFTVAFHWIGFAFLVDASTYLWMMPFMVGALAGGMAIYWGIATVIAKRLGRSGLPLTLTFAASLGPWSGSGGIS